MREEGERVEMLKRAVREGFAEKRTVQLPREGSVKVSPVTVQGGEFQAEGAAKVPPFFSGKPPCQQPASRLGRVPFYETFITICITLLLQTSHCTWNKAYVSYHAYKVLFNPFTSPNSSPSFHWLQPQQLSAWSLNTQTHSQLTALSA